MSMYWTLLAKCLWIWCLEYEKIACEIILV